MQTITLNNGRYSTCINRTGAELKSFKNITTGREYLWQSDPSIWAGCAPILFPVIGRMIGGGYIWKGKEYTMPKHGLVRNRDFQVKTQETEELVLFTESDEMTQLHYPFQWRLEVTFTFLTHGLKVGYQVFNPAETPLLFSIGSHPAFNIPADLGKLEDYCIEFEKPESFKRYRLIDGLVNTTPEPIPHTDGSIQLSSDIFNDDALVMKQIDSQFVFIRNRAKNFCIRFDTGGAPDLGIWSKPGASYVCLEPWYGYDDPIDHDRELTNKPGILVLKNNDKASFYYSFEVNESPC